MTEKLLKKLAARGKEEGVLPELLEFYRRLLQIQFNAEQRLDTLKTSPSTEGVNRRLEQGQSALDFAGLNLDWAFLREIFTQVMDIFIEYRPLFDIPEAVDKTRYPVPWLKKTVQSWFEGKNLPPGVTNALDEHHLADVLQATLRPFLAVHRKTLLPLVDQESWRRGYCPICGGRPDFAVLDKERGARWLICSRCDAEWLFQRLECPHCGTKDQNALAYFTDDEGRFRLCVCAQCQQYIKTVDLRLSKAEFQLPLERFFTLGIDIQAQEQAYSLQHAVPAVNSKPS